MPRPINYRHADYRAVDNSTKQRIYGQIVDRGVSKSPLSREQEQQLIEEFLARRKT